jgi:hypothetical protein
VAGLAAKARTRYGCVPAGAEAVQRVASSPGVSATMSFVANCDCARASSESRTSDVTTAKPFAGARPLERLGLYQESLISFLLFSQVYNANDVSPTKSIEPADTIMIFATLAMTVVLFTVRGNSYKTPHPGVIGNIIFADERARIRGWRVWEAGVIWESFDRQSTTGSNSLTCQRTPPTPLRGSTPSQGPPLDDPDTIYPPARRCAKLFLKLGMPSPLNPTASSVAPPASRAADAPDTRRPFRPPSRVPPVALSPRHLLLAHRSFALRARGFPRTSSSPARTTS